jgi:alkanesulfonate monooxygenase SsuD/methylene tetrahydromethanopterin reductase-like flavin-dependent oxidoreductase (luciferase family)
MKFGIFYELQLPRPWEAGGELKLYQDALTQLETADRCGYDHAWVVEHHFLEEYSHSPSPESFLAAASLPITPRASPSASRCWIC